MGMPAVRRTVEPRHDRLVAAIGYIVHQATIAAIEVERFQNAEVAVILDVTARIAGSLVKVDDTGIQAMSRIEFTEHCAMQPLIVSHTSEFHTPNTGLSRSVISIRRTPPPEFMMPSGANPSWARIPSQ